jgi:hypothetical protein
VAEANCRFLIYRFTDAGEDGHSNPTYALDTSSIADDGGFWGTLSFISGLAKLAGDQDEQVVTYDMTFSRTVPLVNGDKALIVVLPESVPVLKVLSTAELRNTGEKQSRCLHVSDGQYTLTD